MDCDYTADEAIERWDALADQYAADCSEFGDPNKTVLLTPVILRMAGDVTSQRLLDAGCGEGFLSRLFAKGGANVTAVDYSKALLDIAATRTPDELAIDYRHANLEALDGFDDETFDMVVSCCVFHDLPDYVSALSELHRVLVPQGRFILAMTHPCFSSDGGWARDSEGNKLHWKTDNYFRERAVEVDWPPGSKNKPINFHRTLTSYFRNIHAAGFSIEDLEEPMPSERAIQEHPHFLDDLRMSHFIVFDLRREP